MKNRYFCKVFVYISLLASGLLMTKSAIDLYEEGNTAFKAGNLDEAYKLYRYIYLLVQSRKFSNSSFKFSVKPCWLIPATEALMPSSTSTEQPLLQNKKRQTSVSPIVIKPLSWIQAMSSHFFVEQNVTWKVNSMRRLSEIMKIFWNQTKEIWNTGI